MTAPEPFHCRACSTRPRANLTRHDGLLWRPECLYTVAAMQWATQTLAPHRPEAPRTVGERAGLLVVDLSGPAIALRGARQMKAAQRGLRSKA
jgi:hypothetical protein